MKWFKHESRSNRDAKMEKLLMKYGSDGYALYWLCLELIAERIDIDCADFELEHDAETLGARLKVDTLRVEEIMKYMVNAGLFESTEGRITCLKLALKIEESTVRNPNIKAIKETVKNTNMLENVRDSSGQKGTSGARLDEIRLDKIRLENTGERASAKAQPAPKQKPIKNKHGSQNNILLTNEEVERLKKDYGEEQTLNAIEYLSTYKERRGYVSKNDNLTIRDWVFQALERKRQEEYKTPVRKVDPNALF